MSVSSWLWRTVARLRAGVTEDSALRAAEERSVAATRGTHPPLSPTNRTASKEAASEFLGERFNRAYPRVADAMIRSGFDPNRAYDREWKEAGWVLDRALDDTWQDGLEFGRWVERAAARAGIA